MGDSFLPTNSGLLQMARADKAWKKTHLEDFVIWKFCVLVSLIYRLTKLIQWVSLRVEEALKVPFVNKNIV